MILKTNIGAQNIDIGNFLARKNSSARARWDARWQIGNNRQNFQESLFWLARAWHGQYTARYPNFLRNPLLTMSCQKWIIRAHSPKPWSFWRTCPCPYINTNISFYEQWHASISEFYLGARAVFCTNFWNIIKKIVLQRNDVNKDNNPDWL